MAGSLAAKNGQRRALVAKAQPLAIIRIALSPKPLACPGPRMVAMRAAPLNGHENPCL
jgi:hypothetical protein